jgi:carboxypeptidase C (cathepsin A)
MAFLSAAIFAHFTPLRGNALHMTGSSYSGRCVPVFSAAIHDLKARLEKAAFAPVNLASVMPFPGMTDHITTELGHLDMACTVASGPPILNIKSLRPLYPTERAADWSSAARACG